MSDVILHKLASVQKHIERIKEDYDDEFDDNPTKQDAVVLNLERACQACIDIATHTIRIHRLGLPGSSSEVFKILSDKKYISDDLHNRMVKMVGFRNIAVHNYSELNLEIVKAIIDKHLSDLVEFTQVLLGGQKKND